MIKILTSRATDLRIAASALPLVWLVGLFGLAWAAQRVARPGPGGPIVSTEDGFFCCGVSPAGFGIREGTGYVGRSSTSVNLGGLCVQIPVGWAVVARRGSGRHQEVVLGFRHPDHGSMTVMRGNARHGGIRRLEPGSGSRHLVAAFYPDLRGFGGRRWRPRPAGCATLGGQPVGGWMRC